MGLALMDEHKTVEALPHSSGVAPEQQAGPPAGEAGTYELGAVGKGKGKGKERATASVTHLTAKGTLLETARRSPQSGRFSRSAMAAEAEDTYAATAPPRIRS